jgi:hypothetical protein
VENWWQRKLNGSEIGDICFMKTPVVLTYFPMHTPPITNTKTAGEIIVATTDAATPADKNRGTGK